MRTIAEMTQREVTVIAQSPETRWEVILPKPAVEVPNNFFMLATPTVDVVDTQKLCVAFPTTSTGFSIVRKNFVFEFVGTSLDSGIGKILMLVMPSLRTRSRFLWICQCPFTSLIKVFLSMALIVKTGVYATICLLTLFAPRMKAILTSPATLKEFGCSRKSAFALTTNFVGNYFIHAYNYSMERLGIL
jgi:hypothetical protein